VELDTLNIDVSRLQEALTPRTRMVVAANILGNPCALKTLKRFCDDHGLYLFEDNCESMGAELNGVPCGTFGDIGTFSTFYSHHISTMEGGVIVTKDEEIYHLLQSLRAHGWTRGLPRDSRIYDPSGEDFAETYRFLFPGYNARPLEIAGAVGIRQLRKLDRVLEMRCKNADIFQGLFRADERFIIQRENGKSSWFSFAIVLNPQLAVERKGVLESMRESGIEFRTLTGGNFLRHDAKAYFDYECVGEIVHADTAHDRGFFVGNHSCDLHRELRLFWEVLDRAVK
jgi:CDP-6-deoxy-D-xylo-4-hexulose-3-dehydrase